MNSKKTIIFDFDGIILESVDAKTNGFRLLFSKYGNQISDKVVEYHLLNTGISRYEKFKYYFKHYLKES